MKGGSIRVDGTARFALFIIVFFTRMKGKNCKKGNFFTILSSRLNDNFFIEPRNVRIEKNLKTIGKEGKKKKKKQRRVKHSFPGNEMAFVSLREASEAHVIA